jgi:predicted DNA-binding helix-hairpin-helix protein
MRTVNFGKREPGGISVCNAEPNEYGFISCAGSDGAKRALLRISRLMTSMCCLDCIYCLAPVFIV